MTSTVVPTVRCPKAGDQDLPFRFLIYHTFVSVKQFHLDNLGVRGGQEVIDVPPTPLLFRQMPGDPCLDVLPGASCVDISSSWKFECAQLADYQNNWFFDDKMDLV